LDALIAALAVVLAAGVSALVTWLLGRGKARVEPERLRAEVAVAITKAAGQLVGDMRKDIENLRARQVFLEQQIISQEAEIDRLGASLELAENRIAELEQENTRLRAELRDK